MSGGSFLLREWWGAGTGCPERLWILHPWMCPRPGWMGPWAIWSSTWSNACNPAHGRGVGTWWSLWSLPTQVILWYLCLFHLAPTCSIVLWSKKIREFFSSLKGKDIINFLRKRFNSVSLPLLGKIKVLLSFNCFQNEGRTCGGVAWGVCPDVKINYQHCCQKGCSALSSPPEVICIWRFMATKPRILCVLPPLSQGGQLQYASDTIHPHLVHPLPKTIYAVVVWFKIPSWSFIYSFIYLFLAHIISNLLSCFLGLCT